MNTSILVKEQFAKNIIEFLTGTNISYLFTEPKMFGGEKLVIFVVSGSKEDVEFFSKWVGGAFSTFSAIVMPFHLDEKNKLTDIFYEVEE